MGPTQVLLWGKVVRALMGLRPVFINPRTLVRSWSTQTELCEVVNFTEKRMEIREPTKPQRKSE